MATLKDRALKWFMSLRTNSIRSWNDMQNIFLEKYKDRDLKEETFRMNKKEYESLKDLIERFRYTIKREKLHHLGSDTIKTLLLRTIRDDWIDILDLMSKGDVYQLSFEEICETCKQISRRREIVSISASRSVSQAKLGNLFDDFKKNYYQYNKTSRNVKNAR